GFDLVDLLRGEARGFTCRQRRLAQVRGAGARGTRLARLGRSLALLASENGEDHDATDRRDRASLAWGHRAKTGVKRPCISRQRPVVRVWTESSAPATVTRPGECASRERMR